MATVLNDPRSRRYLSSLVIAASHNALSSSVLCSKYVYVGVSFVCVCILTEYTHGCMLSWVLSIYMDDSLSITFTTDGVPNPDHLTPTITENLLSISVNLLESSVVRPNRA